MAKWHYNKGLQGIGDGVYAYLQPDGSTGWSNAGLIESRGETLLVDTLMTVGLTRDMLDEMKRQVPVSAKIDKLVNTHANIDHFAGNELVLGAEIIAGKGTAEEIAEIDWKQIIQLMDNPKGMNADVGEYFWEIMGSKFDLHGITVTPPTRTYERELELDVGEKRVRLVDLGPAHTKCDTIVHVPGDKVIFTGDLLFHESTPVMWAGPMQNWIKACDYMLAADVEIIVPGHGPIAEKSGVRKQKAYFEYVRDETRKRYDSGMGWEEAARDMSLGEFAQWPDPERIVSNVFALYREFGAPVKSVSPFDVFAAMGRRWRQMNPERGAP